jgi:hypothetical protein
MRSNVSKGVGFFKQTHTGEWDGHREGKGGQNVHLSDLPILIRSSNCTGRYNRQFQGPILCESCDCIDTFKEPLLNQLIIICFNFRFCIDQLYQTV